MDKKVIFYCPLKVSPLSPYHSRLVNKEVSEANMKQAELRSKYLKLLTNQIRLMYTRQKNCCSSPIRKQKKDFYGNLDIEIK